MLPLNLLTRLDNELLLPSIVTVMSSSSILYSLVFPLDIIAIFDVETELMVPLTEFVDSEFCDIIIIAVAIPPLHTATIESPVPILSTVVDLLLASVTFVAEVVVNVLDLPLFVTVIEYPEPELVFSLTLPEYCVTAPDGVFVFVFVFPLSVLYAFVTSTDISARLILTLGLKLLFESPTIILSLLSNSR